MDWKGEEYRRRNERGKSIEEGMEGGKVYNKDWKGEEV